MVGFWLYLHILLLVFWVGTDLGVFLAAKYSERAALSYETRATLLQLGMVLDRLPRSALTLIIPSGLSLAHAAGFDSYPPSLLPAAWMVAGAWLLVLWRGFMSGDPAVQERCALINWLMNMAMAVVVSTAALYLLLMTSSPLWLSLKMLAVGGIFIIGTLLDYFFRPAVGYFAALAERPDEPELNALYSRALAPVYVTVLTIYALALAAAALGVFKP